MTLTITANQVAKIGGRRRPSALDKQIAATINEHGSNFHLDTTLRVAHFLGQCSVESSGFKKLKESLDYSTSGLRKTFGKHRISTADCNRLGRVKGKRKANQKGIANRVYGGPWGKENLGNTHPNDGWNFRGSSIKQITGRGNFAEFTKWIKSRIPSAPDFTKTPDLLRAAKWAVWPAIWYWESRKCYRYADKDDVHGLTVRINGGTNGLNMRRSETAQAKIVLKAGSVKPTEPDPYVMEVQRLLNRHGHKLRVDGDNGPATKAAVRVFQEASGLTVDSVAGPETLAALKKQPEAEKQQAELQEIVEDAAATDRISKEELGAGALAIGSAVQPVREVMNAVNEAKETASEATDVVTRVVGLGPWILLGLVMVGIAVFVWFRRRLRKNRSRAVLS